MNTSKFLIGGIIGGIVYFFLGWLVWGMLLTDFMQQHTTEAGKAVMRGEEGMIWWAMIVGNLLWGLTLSYVLSKSGVATAGAGATTGAILGLFVSAAINCMLYAQLNAWDITSVVVDVVANTIVGGIVGGIVGWYFGMGRKAAA
jgi:uncharacterized membrane protein